MPLSKSSRNRELLVARIRLRGVIMAFRCVRCQKSGSDCVRSRDSSSCLVCVENGKPCEMEPFSCSDFAKVDKERARLDAEEDKANEEVAAYSARVNAALAKAARIRKLRRFLASREAEMIRRGLENVEELEKLEEQEKLEAELLSATTVATSSAGNIASPSSFSGFEDFLAQEHPDLFGGTSQLASGSS